MIATNAKPTDEPWLKEFPPVRYEDWRKLVEGELKDASFDGRMLTPTAEGITLRPLYLRDDLAKLAHRDSFPGFPPFVRGANAAPKPWEISQEINCSSPAEFNHYARNSLAAGLNALNMVLDKATRAGNDPDWAGREDVGSGGLSIATLLDLERALEGVDLKKTSLFVRSGASGMPFAALLAALVNRRKQQPSDLHGCIEMDPLGVLAHEGVLPQSLPCAYREMESLARWAANHAPRLQTICVHSRSWHESGGNAVQELAFTLATAVEYLRELHNRDLEVNIVAPRIRFAVTVGTTFFLEIAKLRALRMLWARAVAASEGDEDAQKLRMHVRTSLWNKTTRDSHNNILRSTLEAFAAALGGCDSLQVGAFDEVVRPPDDFSRRLARNTQLILQKECRVNRVMDPAGGSWYVETLTCELANRAWALFQEVEKLGGMAAALQAGFPQKLVAATAAEKIKAVNERRTAVVGVNKYANPKETPVTVPVTDEALFYKRRVQQVGSYRTSLDDADNDAVLKVLSDIVNTRGVGLFASCVEAVSAGATLGEIVRAIRIHDRPCSPTTPVCLTRAAASFEDGNL
jgi:methylmalonyl-CoA mutase